MFVVILFRVPSAESPPQISSLPCDTEIVLTNYYIILQWMLVFESSNSPGTSGRELGFHTTRKRTSNIYTWFTYILDLSSSVLVTKYWVEYKRTGIAKLSFLLLIN